MFVSSSDHEGLSNSMLEAMAIGLPTVCTDCPCGGARMVIEDRENGILTPVGDKDALYRAMCEVIDNDVLRNKISENALRVKESYSLDKILGEWKSIIE